MIESAPRNMMATPFRVRDDVGPHQHEWVEVGRDAQGEVYRECRVCNARSCMHRPRFQAMRQNWLAYRESWAAVEAAADDDDAETEPVKRRPGRPRKSA